MSLPTNLLRFLGGTATGLAATGALGLAASPADATHTNFTGINCNTTGKTDLTSRSRAQSWNYATVAQYEGYQWGGGCWNNNNVDDAPNDPAGVPNQWGEGGDCSGFTFKSWYLSTSSTDKSFDSWQALTNVHGPFTASSYYNACACDTNSFRNMAKADADLIMDAFASTDHIGTVHQSNTAVNTDNIIEAKSESSGTGVFSRTYRGSTSYRGVLRKGWA